MLSGVEHFVSLNIAHAGLLQFAPTKVAQAVLEDISIGKAYRVLVLGFFWTKPIDFW